MSIRFQAINFVLELICFSDAGFAENDRERLLMHIAPNALALLPAKVRAPVLLFAWAGW